MRLSPSPGKSGGAQHPFPRLDCSENPHLPALCRVPALPVPKLAVPTQGQRQDRQWQAASTGCCALQGPRCQLTGPKSIPEEEGSQIWEGTRIPGVLVSE